MGWRNGIGHLAAALADFALMFCFKCSSNSEDQSGIMDNFVLNRRDWSPEIIYLLKPGGLDPYIVTLPSWAQSTAPLINDQLSQINCQRFNAKNMALSAIE